MFKLGGQANQGSGIMSHVEPRQNYMFGNVAQPLTPFQTAYADLPIQNYAMGGRIGYAGAGPVMPGTLPGAGFKIPSWYPTSQEQVVEPTTVSSDNTGINSLAQRRLEKLQGLPSFNPVKPLIDYYKGNRTLDTILMQEGLINEKSTLPEIAKARRDYRGKFVQEKPEMEFGRQDTTGETEQQVETKDYKTKEGKDTDPRSEIKKEADMLKSMLRDEGLTTAENALIIAKALGTPGGINAKIAAAGDLALPVLRERAKLDKEAVLKAYEKTSDLEKARIAAGKKSATQDILDKAVQTQLNVAIKSVDPVTGETLYNGKTRDQIESQVYGAYTQKIPYAEQKAATLVIEKAKENIARETEAAAKKGKQPDPKIIQKNQDAIKRSEQLLSGQLYATGGRVNKAIGGMSVTEDTTTEDTASGTTGQSETIVDTNVDGFPMKPVQKLSFEEIRNRLPQEITDDIVRLIANSAEALQDFAYIKTQQDVNQFNVKYGVNLVLPQNT
jgi:hypothetical protein